MDFSDFQPTPERIALLHKKMQAFDVIPNITEEQRKALFHQAIQEILEAERLQKAQAEQTAQDSVTTLYHSLFAKPALASDTTPAGTVNNSPSLDNHPKATDGIFGLYAIDIEEVDVKAEQGALPSDTKVIAHSLIDEGELSILQNRFVHAFGALSRKERQLVLLMLSKIRQQSAGETVHHVGSLPCLTLTADEVVQNQHCSSEAAYQFLEEAADALLKRHFRYHDIESYDNVVKKSHRVTVSCWVIDCIYDADNLSVTLLLNQNIVALMEAFQTNTLFIQSQQDVMLQMSANALALFELAVKNLLEGYHVAVCAVDYLRNITDCDNTYPKISDFKNYVIDKSIQDIHQFSDVRITYQVEKKSRVITDLVFTFSDSAGEMVAVANAVPARKDSFDGFKMTEQELQFYANKISQVLGTPAAQVAHELADVTLQKNHIERLKFLDYQPTQWF